MNSFVIIFVLAIASASAQWAWFGGENGASHGQWDHHDDHHAKYKFEYGVKDAHTGDHKEAHEHRDGHLTKGGYWLAEADGTKRVVEYHSDGKSGLHAVVKRIGHAHHPAVYGHHGHDGAGAGWGGEGWSGQGWSGKGGVSYQNNNLY